MDRFLQSYSRRDLLRFVGLASTTIFSRWDPFRSVVNGATNLVPGAIAASLPRCIVRPEQTEGPYFVDEKLHRTDIRGDPSDNSLSAGVPLRLEFHVSRLSGGACTPLSGAVVDVWHCNALGAYSDVRDSQFDTRGKKFLRGFQRTDGNGMAEFLSIYPGWYEGRAVHIHFKIRSGGSDGRAHEFTSQLYFDEAVSDMVFQQAPYNGKRGRRRTNETDSLFRRGGKELLLAPTKGSQGYAAQFAIGLQAS
jgi:protocatechuate 3,4-dioxygenase beta subunit